MDTSLFTVDGQEYAWKAVRFGEPWNGWLTPVIKRETLENLLSFLGDGYRWKDDVALVWPTIDLGRAEVHDPETEDRLQPDGDGTYDLGELGWAFTPARS